MVDKSGIRGYKRFYASLVRLYPKPYQKRFSEPMLQTFSDVCRERVRSGKGLFAFAVQTYAGTFIEIIREHFKEGIMSSRKTKVKVLAAAGGIAVLVAASIFIVAISNQSARSIAPFSSLEHAKQLSKGKKAACLMDSQQAVDAVNKDDGYYEFNGEKSSNFEMAASAAIMDVPAGTNYKLTIHSYNDGIVRGAMAYEYGYGIYNYEIKKMPGAGEWELISVIACERS